MSEPLSDEVEAKLREIAERYFSAHNRHPADCVARAAYRLGLEAGRAEATTIIDQMPCMDCDVTGDAWPELMWLTMCQRHRSEFDAQGARIVDRVRAAIRAGKGDGHAE